ncbi:LOW QUALITY PROTEIN: telomere repeat-binding protein 2 [Dioscorea cayenensis subsp. rotundata]|uniref:LOW QUALITY PROTEIN: telomere repeat-binding protein 2 n=1 Tax=Dioscorea cayennensis subsp. rotundata TaxID=55577 RepID=A0AB40BW47_DIOCR|nr:LOW QUALITY PROTEIN: telomere repeat-binding protein 2 [Dioscorea cayenensis subsp. rotundata]
MVSTKRLGYGFNGNQSPTMLLVPRSAKGKRSVRKKSRDNHTNAIDMLATIAADLLLESEKSFTAPVIGGPSNPTSNGTLKKEDLFEVKPIKEEAFDQGSCSESVSGSNGGCALKEHGKLNSDVCSKNPTQKELMTKCISGDCGYPFERHSPCYAECWEGNLAGGMRALNQCEPLTNMSPDIWKGLETCILGELMQLDSKPSALVSSDSSVEVPSSEDHIPRNTSFPTGWWEEKQLHLDRDDDDDENCSRCTHGSTITSKVFRSHDKQNDRIKKLLMSKFRKDSRLSTNRDFPNSDVDKKLLFSSRKIGYTRKRTQRYPFKRRKCFHRGLMSTYDEAVNYEYMSNLPEINMKVENFDMDASLHEANIKSSNVTGQRSIHESEDFHVKLRIKSFKVPELFVEIPKSATVGSLKRMVMEAVTAILRGGIHVGVLLQGKKIRDDSKTLLQAGISHGDKLDKLGFILEPDNVTLSPPLLTNHEEPSPLLPCNATEPLTRSPSATPLADPSTIIALPELPNPSAVNSPESDHNSFHFPMDVPLQDDHQDEISSDSRALVPVPATNMNALSIVPIQKRKRPEHSQRRIRRPFSVSEVEALVQAVEMLGTGRWRDVKIRAFDNANHRTYVDLKDKWKTLVHTAKITPQQRRGEPVPQELLDRVLAAHAYWSQQQARLPTKPSPAEDCMLN